MSRPVSFRPWALRGVDAFGRALLRAVLRLGVEGIASIPGTGPVLLAGNHSSALDGPLMVVFAGRPVQALIKAELYGGALGGVLRVLGQIPVRRGQPDRRALTAAVQVLRGGGAVGMFPEGRRGSGEFEQIKGGLAYLALHTGSPIVPVACVGTAAAMPMGAAVPRWRAPVRVVFGEPFQVPVPANPRARRAVAEAAETIRLALAAHLDQASGNRAAPPAPAHLSGGSSG